MQMKVVISKISVHLACDRLVLCCVLCSNKAGTPQRHSIPSYHVNVGFQEVGSL